MSNGLTATRVFWVFAVGASFTAGARAVEPSAISTSSSSEPAAIVRPESSFERAFRLRGWSSASPSWSYEMEVPVEEREFAHESSLMTPDALDTIERRDPSGEFRPTAAVVADSGEIPPVPLHPALTDRFFIGLGGYWSSSNTQARLDSPSGLGTTIDFEDALGLDSSKVVPQALARWRFTNRWRLELEHFQLDRDRTRTTSDDIQWGDETFPAGTSITTEFDFAVTRLSCGYSFFKRQDKELGVALGFHLTDIQARLSSSGGANTDDGKLLAPLPVISMYGQFALTDIWAVSGRMDAFRISYDEYSGHVYSLGLDLLCQPWRHFGFGIGWRGLDVQVAAEKSDWSGEVQTTYSGPIAFASVSF
jgi:hypothetical protein